MDNKDFQKLLKQGRGTVVAFILFFLIIGLIVSLAQPLKYKSNSRLLIVQPNASDAYTVARSNEYIGNLTVGVISSGSFLDALKNSKAVFDRNYFAGNYKDSIKKWNKTVFARSGGDTGIIEIEIYHTDKKEAERLSLAVNDLIVSGAGPYRFNPQEQVIAVIDQPVVSTFPVKPNLPLNLTLSLIFGFLAGASYIYLFPQRVTAQAQAKKIKKIKAAAPVYQTSYAYQYQPVAQAPVADPNNYGGYFTYPEYNEPYDEPSFEEMPTPPVNLPFSSEPFIPNQSQRQTPEFKGNMNNVIGE